MRMFTARPMYKRSYIGLDVYQLCTRRNMKLVVLLAILSVTAAEVLSPEQLEHAEGAEPEKKIEKRSHAVWDPWASTISSHYTYSVPISKVRLVKSGWSSLGSSLKSGWYPDWYVGSPVIVKSSGWSGRWNKGWKW